jgi:hypothetical protein
MSGVPRHPDVVVRLDLRILLRTAPVALSMRGAF